jgi:2-polyprenyl-6-methoxyphenol hydroxylase-like FAD-dependent oxidoreductase
MQLLSAWRFSAAQWAVPGVALLGDAAHCIHPAAGQGMNAAIADAWALAQVLQEEAGSAGYSPSSVNRALVRYDNGRRREFDYVATLSHVMSQICTSRSPFKQWVAQWSLRRNRRNRRLQYKVTYNMSGLGVYRFTLLDRLYQFGLLPDPRAERIGI